MEELLETGDLTLLEGIDVEEHFETLMTSPHLALITELVELYPDALTPELLTPQTPALLEYCAMHGLFLPEVVQLAADAFEGEKLSQVLLAAMKGGVYPPLSVAVQASPEVLSQLLAYDPEQSDDAVAEAFQGVTTEETALVLLDAFPDAILYVDDVINAMEHRIPCIASGLNDAAHLHYLCSGQFPYWRDYGEDLVWLLTLLRPRLEELQFALTPTVVSLVAESRDQELLRDLVAHFPLV